jgi:hypothetical protein
MDQQKARHNNGGLSASRVSLRLAVTQTVPAKPLPCGGTISEGTSLAAE